MATKKYLSLEEAAQLMGVRADEVIRMREKGDLRGFADRGTWKFKADDVEEAKRRRQPDSNPDVPLIDDDDDGDSILLESPASRRDASDSDVRLVFADDDLKAGLTGSSASVPVFNPDATSDSDVRLVGASSGISRGKGSDSDVKLIKSKSSGSDSDSDVRLAASKTDSDSDVRLAMPPGSDSDVKLVEPRSGGSALSTGGDSDSILIDDDDDFSLAGDSGLRLTAESGIQLRHPQDSGILLEGAGSGFNLADDDDDFTFKLAEDSGVKKEAGKSGPKLPAGDLDQTLSMSLADDDDDSEHDRTDPEVPLLMDDDEDSLMPKSFNLGDETQAETSVILFDDEDELDETAATMVKKKSSGLSSKELDASTFDLDADDDEEYSEEILDADDDSFADEDLEEVFADDDDDFSDSYSEEGMSAADFSTARAVSAVTPVAEWGGGTVMLLAFSTLVMMAGAWMACDLLNIVFSSGGPTYNGMFVEAVAGLFQ